MGETMELMCKTVTRGIAVGVCMVNDYTIAIAGGDSTIRLFNWVLEEDLMGEHGFNAHDCHLTHITRYYIGDEEESNWTQQPIKYQTCRPEEGVRDATMSLEILRTALKEALVYDEGKNNF